MRLKLQLKVVFPHAPALAASDQSKVNSTNYTMHEQYTQFYYRG